jgi:hypothetical protein
MSDNTKNSVTLWTWKEVAVLLLLTSASNLVITRIMAGNFWKDRAVEHHAARYNPITGAFEWLDDIPKETK